MGVSVSKKVVRNLKENEFKNKEKSWCSGRVQKEFCGGRDLLYPTKDPSRTLQF